MGENSKSSEDHTRSSPYLFGDQQPLVLSWVLLIQLKILGLALVITGWKKLTSDPPAAATRTRTRNSKDGEGDGSSV